MILGIGTDIVQVDRFKNWENFSQEKLLRVFSVQELEYCGVRMVRQANDTERPFERQTFSLLLRANGEIDPVRGEERRPQAECLEPHERFNLECLSSRFAAKEAFFKAVSASLVNLKLTQTTFSFLFACQNIEVVQDEWQVPIFKINWTNFEEKIGAKLPNFKTYLSISHEKNYSVAFVILSI